MLDVTLSLQGDKQTLTAKRTVFRLERTTLFQIVTQDS
jgi:hypothetical protein